MKGEEGGAGGRVLGQSTYGPALEQARVQAQVQVPFTSRLLPGAVKKVGVSPADLFKSVGSTVGSTRTRAREMAAEARARSGENQPLINGNRFGESRTGRSRLVESEIQPA